MAEITIRQVDPARERQRILAVLAANLPAAAAAERFDWLYLSNPDGRALVWLAENEKGEAVGTSAAYPRRMRVAGESVRGLNLGDFAVDRSQRALGVALRLLGATLGAVRDRSHALSYDFASPSMHAVYRRMRLRALARRERWLQPVDTTRLLSRKLGGGPLTAAAGLLGDALWRARRATGPRAGEVTVEAVAAECGDEFDALDARLAAGRRVAGVRDAAYLNWRFLRNPVWKDEILCARAAGGRLAGYAALRRFDADTVSLLEIDGEDLRLCRILLAAAVQWAAARGAAALQVETLAGSPTSRLVKALGFVRREADDGPVVFTAADAPLARQLGEAKNWWLIGGDRDV
jgi:predicted N-acetyltransferase YhbS